MFYLERLKLYWIEALLIMGNLALNLKFEARYDMDDPEFKETLQFMAAEIKKKCKQELEEGHANPKRSTKPAQPKARAYKKL